MCVICITLFYNNATCHCNVIHEHMVNDNHCFLSQAKSPFKWGQQSYAGHRDTVCVCVRVCVTHVPVAATYVYVCVWGRGDKGKDIECTGLHEPWITLPTQWQGAVRGVRSAGWCALGADTPNGRSTEREREREKAQTTDEANKTLCWSAKGRREQSKAGNI